MQYAKSTKYLRSFQFLPCILSHLCCFFSKQPIFADRVPVYRLHIFLVLLHIMLLAYLPSLGRHHPAQSGRPPLYVLHFYYVIHIMRCAPHSRPLFRQPSGKNTWLPAASPPFFRFFRFNSVVLIRYFSPFFRQISASYFSKYMHIDQNNSSIILLICQ